MGRILLPAAAFFLLFTGHTLAGRPVNGYFYYSYIPDSLGHNIGKVEWNWDGRKEFTLGAPQTFPGVEAAYSLVYTWDQSLLVAGRYEDEVYRIKPGQTAYDVQKNSWDNPEHIAVDPGLKSAWITDNRGALYRQPLDPYGKAVQVRPTGSETGISTISYRDADAAWYTLSTPFDSTRIGELDPRDMSTRRRLSVKPIVNDAHYDPFTRHVLLCGDKTLLQYDPEANAIVSQREFKHVSELYSCVVDGEGHVILSSWNGEVFFIDYSVTGRVGDSSNPADSTHLVEGMYCIAPLIGPGSPPRIYRPIYVGTRGTYRDDDGDGRIDGAVLEFKTAVPDAPAKVRLSNPADIAVPMDFDSTHIARLDPTRYLVDFRDRPLAFGTTVRPGAVVRILADTTLFGNVDLPMEDDVGPQVVTAEAHPPQKKGDKPVLAVTFSEGVDVSLASKRFPFLIKRPNAEVDGKIRVESIRDLGSGRFEYVLAPEEFPLLGDSLKLIPGDTTVRDTAGNLNNMSIWIWVGGESLPAFSILTEPGACVVSYSTAAPLPLAPALFLVHPTPQGSLCLNCADNKVAEGLVTQAPPLGMEAFHPWLLTIKVQGPVRYSFNFYSSLGTFVNSAAGEVTPEMLGKMRLGADRHYTIRLYWWPVAQDGRQAGTGAFIMRGVLSEPGLGNPLPPQVSESPGQPKKAEKISVTFGYLRRH